MMAVTNRYSKQDRAGTYVRQSGGFRAFIPAPLPPNPPLIMANDLIMLLADAQGALGRLDGSTETLPDPDFFVGMFSRQEAMLSSRIEGTQATLIQVLELEIGASATQSGDAQQPQGSRLDRRRPIRFVVHRDHEASWQMLAVALA